VHVSSVVSGHTAALSSCGQVLGCHTTPSHVANVAINTAATTTTAAHGVRLSFDHFILTQDPHRSTNYRHEQPVGGLALHADSAACRELALHQGPVFFLFGLFCLFWFLFMVFRCLPPPRNTESRMQVNLACAHKLMHNAGNDGAGPLQASTPLASSRQALGRLAEGTFSMCSASSHTSTQTHNRHTHTHTQHTGAWNYSRLPFRSTPPWQVARLQPTGNGLGAHAQTQQNRPDRQHSAPARHLRCSVTGSGACATRTDCPPT